MKENIGRERFLALGFDNMGEVVSCKWTEEDEQLFHDVVYSNPASLGKNFWDHLEETFPSRTNQEIVSYYFNVFVLQRRAEQNIYDPTNADSDDDEWQGSDTDEEEEELCQNEIEKYSLSIKDSIFDTKVYDFQEESCTSFAFQEPEISDVKVDFRKSWATHDFIFE
ncbi:homeodomain-like protein [Tanacetum coccineum]